MKSRYAILAAVLLLTACQATPTPAPIPIDSPQPSPTPTPLERPTAVSSAVPTPVPFDSQNPPPVFSNSPGSVCFAEELSIELARSNLNRGKVSILLQVPRDISQIPESDIRPVRDIPTDPVVLGEMDVSPLGTGQFSFSLAETYTTKSGAKVTIPRTFVSLYAETSPGTYARINDVKICPSPAPTPLPNQPPTPLPDTTPVTIPMIDVGDATYQTQEVYAFAQNQISYDFSIKLLDGNGFILWHYPYSSPSDKPAGGRLIRGLKLSESLAVQNFPNLTSMNVYFNQAGDGLFSWSSAAGKFLTPMKNLLPVGEAQTMSETIQQVAFDVSGQGNLYVIRSSEQNRWQLWRYLIEGFKTTGQVQQVASLPYYPRNIVFDAQGTGFIQTSREKYAWPETPFENQIIEFANHQQTDSWSLLEQARAEIGFFPQGQGTMLFEEFLNPSPEPLNWSAYPVRNFKLEASQRLMFPRSEGQPAAIKVNTDGKGLYAIAGPDGLKVRQINHFQPEGPYYRLVKANTDTNYSVQIDLDASGSGLIVWHERDPEPSSESSHNAGRLLMRAVKDHQTW